MLESLNVEKGSQRDLRNISNHFCEEMEFTLGMPLHSAPVNIQIDIEYSQGSKVGRIEGTYPTAALLGRSISSEDLVVEVDTDFGDLEGTSHENGTKKIINCITSEFTHGDLGPSHNHCLIQMFKHEAQGRGCVGHCVRSMANDEPFVVIVVISHGPRHLLLIFEGYTAGVDEVVIFKHSELYSILEWSQRRNQGILICDFMFSRELLIPELLV